MKHRHCILTALFIFYSCCINAQFIAAKIQINGTVSSSTSFSVYKSLQTVEFIDSVIINVNTTTAYIKFDTTQKVNFKLIAEKITDAGFSIGKCIGICLFNAISPTTTNCIELKGDLYKIIQPHNNILNGKQSILFWGKNYMSKKEFTKWKQENPNETTCKPTIEFTGTEYMISILP